MVAEELQQHPAQPAIAGILVIARVPVLPDREALDWQRAFVDPEAVSLRQGGADVPRQGDDEVGVADHRADAQKAG